MNHTLNADDVGTAARYIITLARLKHPPTDARCARFRAHWDQLDEDHRVAARLRALAISTIAATDIDAAVAALEE